MRGIDSRNEIDPTLLLRDTRTFGQRLAHFFTDPTSVAIVLFSSIAAVYVFPEVSIFILIAAIVMFLIAYNKKQTLPFRLPKVSHIKDYNDLKPGTGKPNIARGITYFGNEIKSNEELWFSNEDMRTHVLIFGSTGSGKTEALISIAYNALVQSSGFIYVDGKGDNSLYAKIFSMVRSMGREDDLLLINFMTGARDIVGPQEKRLSNTLNPFCQGSSSMLTQLVVSLMGESSQNSDGDMWKGRAIAFVEGLMRLLVYMRDEGAILLDANTIRNYFPLDRLESIVIDKIFPRDDQESINIESIPKLVTDPLRNYLHTLPGYNKEKKGKQVSQVLEQHGFITMQLVRAFSSLADTYGHIVRTNLAEVDFKDVVLNRRILVVLLPALEKSPDELSNLGKIIVSSLKAMMAAGLGEDVEGDYRDIIERKPTTSVTPYICILDEYGYYAVQGFAVVPAQARSLGFSTIFAGQDLPAFQKASKEEAASIGANTNIKICMKLEDPTETWDFFTKTAGEAYVTKVDSFQTKETSIANSYLDTKSSSFEKRARIDLLDLKEQTEGEAHIFFRSKIVRARFFYANPARVNKIKLNQFLKVGAPSDDYLSKLQQQLNNFRDILKNANTIIDTVEENDELESVCNYMKKINQDDLIQAGVKTLIEFYERTAPQDIPEIEYEEEAGKVNIYSTLKQPEGYPPIFAKDVALFCLPMLMIKDTRDLILSIERYIDRKNKNIGNIANELTLDLKTSTNYPPAYLDNSSVEELTAEVKILSRRIKEEREIKTEEK